LDDDIIEPERNDEPDGSDIMDGCIASFMQRHRGEGPPEISTGIKALDRAIIGLRPKKMYIFAARPSMGKTALADTIRRAVMNQGYVVCEFSLEMGSEEIGERELAFQAQINLRKVMAAREVSEAELARVVGASGSVPRGLWWVYDNCFSMDDIVRRCRAAKKRATQEGKKIGLVVIDYLQLLSDQGTEGRQQSVSACSRMTKLLSKEMDAAVIALSQLNRNCEFREDRRPMMSDIRESGSIEQDADLIAFLYREHVYNTAVSPEQTELIIRKQRSGPIGTVHLRFNPKTVHFDDVPPAPVATSEITYD
jgi:replicative DNA helicase